MKVEDLLNRIAKSKTLEVVEWKDSPTRLRLVGRINKAVQRQWKSIMLNLLLLEKKSVVSVDISRIYLLTGSEDDVVFAWRVIFQKEGVETAYDHIAHVFSTSKPVALSVEIATSEEVPLVGRRVPTRGRVGPAGSFPVGPAAAASVSSTWQK